MINWSLDADTVTHSIQLALAPVFFLTAVAGMIGAVAGRLARIIDRARKLEELLRNPQEEEFIARSLTELHFLRKRGRLANVCIGLLTVCGFCIGLTIALLFLGEAYGINGHGYAVLGFLFGVLMFLGTGLLSLGNHHGHQPAGLPHPDPRARRGAHHTAAGTQRPGTG